MSGSTTRSPPLAVTALSRVIWVGWGAVAGGGAGGGGQVARRVINACLHHGSEVDDNGSENGARFVFEPQGGDRPGLAHGVAVGPAGGDGVVRESEVRAVEGDCAGELRIRLGDVERRADVRVTARADVVGAAESGG